MYYYGVVLARSCRPFHSQQTNWGTAGNIYIVVVQSSTCANNPCLPSTLGAVALSRYHLLACLYKIQPPNHPYLKEKGFSYPELVYQLKWLG